jgi:hypothetical protein
MVYAQVIKNKSKQKWWQPYVLIAKGMKSLHGIRSMCDHVFCQTTIIVAYVVIVNVCYTIFKRIESIIMMSIKVQKSFFMIRIFTCCWVCQEKMWENSLWTCAPFSKTIIKIVAQRVLWVVVHSFPQGHQNKWVPKSLVVWPH